MTSRTEPLHRTPWVDTTRPARRGSTGQRYRQLVRCLRLLRLVRDRATIDIAAIAQQLRVSTRTIRRDLAALRAAGEPVPSGTEGDLAA